MSSRPSSPAPIHGATTTMPGGPHTSISRCSGGLSPSVSSPRCTSLTTRSSRTTRSSTRSPTRQHGNGWSAVSTWTTTRPAWALGFVFDIVLRGSAATPFEDPGTRRDPPSAHPVADRRPVPAHRAGLAGRCRRRARGARQARCGCAAGSTTARARSCRTPWSRRGRPTRTAASTIRTTLGERSRAPGFRGFGRCATGPDGEWAIRTVKPGVLPTTGGQSQAPHIDVSVFARGLLDRVVTRLYFSDEADANEIDPVLVGIPEHRRGTLVAQRTDDGYHFDVRLQGAGETVFFDL